MNELLLKEILKQGYNTDLFNKEKISLTSLIDEVLYTALRFQDTKENMIIVKNNAYEATEFYAHLTQYLKEDECYLFIPEESLRVEAISSSPENKAQTIEVLYHMQNDKVKVVVASSASLIRYLPNPQLFQENSLNIKVNDEFTIQEIKEKLIQSGYKFTARVDQPLTFSVRGGIIDVYSINHEHPIRIEFFDTEVESIRYFDIQTQRTIQTINETYIIPATTLMFKEEELIDIEKTIIEKIEKKPESAGLFEQDLQDLKFKIPENRLYLYYSFLKETYTMLDYISNPTILLMDEKKIINHIKTYLEDTMTYIQEMSSANKMIARFSVFKDWQDNLKNHHVIKSDVLDNENKTKVAQISLPQGSLSFKVEQLVKGLHPIKVILIKSQDAQEVMDELLNQKINYHLAFDFLQDGVNVVYSELPQGFEFNQLYVVTSNELYFKKEVKGRFVNRYKEATTIDGYQDLKKYDYVVHNQYGIGQYIGIITKEYKGIHKDYLQIVYAENDELLVPLEQFHMIRKYASNTGISIKLHKIGSNKWKKTKEKVQENVQELARRLTELYALRKENIGFAYEKDSQDQIDFENEFEYPLTPDQEIAIEEVKRDMEKPFPMDRLICGDVGFGKTEVSIRAAFKAVYQGKQVAFLCPTTVLSSQHYKTFIARFKHYAVNIEVMNRFVTPAKQKEVIQQLKEGKIDILIGTHRVLSKDIEFKDLGLLIIDEEQRFGVEHKEKIQEIKTGVDVLSLSATPIPRTLQMSLIGMRQLSTLNTPPLSRLPVQTYVVEKTSGLINEVIQRELLRNGQVFYLYNHVERIYEIHRRLQNQFANINVAVVHGQMNKEDIEDVMIQFNENKIQVLVCTTIIETGIDIANANTILIENAHRFGLSQLYQIKGRVGRSSRLAYAYLMIPKDMQVKEIQEKRLKAIKEFTELGSGYKIAQRDLTIRGAGEILGPQQSGFIDSVGIDLYLEMLKEAIDVEKGIVKPEEKIAKVNTVKTDAYIPKAYAPDDYEKIEVYKHLRSLTNVDDLLAYEAFIQDRHGKMPKYVYAIFRKREIELIADETYVELIKETKTSTQIELTKNFSDQVDGVKLFEMLNEISKTLQIAYKNQKIMIQVPRSKNELDLILRVVRNGKESKR